jgi:microcystin-dependent protein
MSTPFLAEIKIVPWGFPPKGWASCNGQLLPINQNQALFSLLGTTYGGNGQTNFALPDFRGRAPMHSGQGFTLGQSGGQEFHTVNAGETPAHTHQVNAQSAAGSTNMPLNNFLANSNVSPYRTDSNTTFAPAMVSTVGGSQPHENRQPFLVLNFVIALQGIFPSRN